MALSNFCKVVGIVLVGATVVVVVFLIFRSFPLRACRENELMYRYDGKCYSEGAKGPCKNNLILMKLSARSSYGECSCPYTKFNRTLVYHEETEQCYFIFTKAYCGPHQWLTFIKDDNNKWKPACRTDTCIQEPGPDNQFRENVQRVPIKGGKCARLGMHEEECPEGAVVQFHKDQILPSCSPLPPSVFIGSIGVPASKCRSGSYPSITGKCVPAFDFDFD